MSDYKVELYLSGGNGSNGGQIDLYPDEPISISMAFNDVSDVSVLKTSFSQQFLIPGSKNNNQLFTNIFNITSDSLFDPRKKVPAYITVSDIPVMTGNLQLTDIFTDDMKGLSYQIVIFGETSGLIDSITDNYLENLNFSALNHTYTSSAITNSWSSSTSLGYYYPLIDYGYGLSLYRLSGAGGAPAAINTDMMFPATYAKTILDNIFSSTGYTYSSTIFNGPDFARTLIPFNGSTNVSESVAFTTGRTFEAFLTANTIVQSNYIDVHSNQNNSPEFSFSATNIVYNPNGLYNGTTFKYSADTNFIQTLGVQLFFNANPSSNAAIQGTQIVVRFYRSTYASGTVAFDTDYYNAPQTNLFQTQLFGTYVNDLSSPTNYPTRAGETFWATWEVYTQLGNNIGPGFNMFELSGNSFWYNSVSNQLTSGQNLDYNIFIPQKVKQIDFLNSLLTMYNCFVIQDRNQPNNIILENRDIFYSTGATKDWTSKFDASQKIQQTLISELNPKKITLTHKSDSDYFNDNYQTITNRTYGDYIFEINNDFSKEEQIISTIFSPTPVSAIPSGGYAFSKIGPSSFIIPVIEKLNASNQASSTNFNIRIVQKSTGGTIPLTGEYWIFNNTVQNALPYVGMVDNPLFSNSDLSFGATNYVYYTASTITSNNLQNLYWDKYLTEISDKNSRLVVANLYLTPSDIQNFDWSDSIYIEGMTDGGGNYYHVNKIDYTCTQNVPSRVELIKIDFKYVPKTLQHYIPLNTGVNLGIRTNGVNLGNNTVLSQSSVVVGAGNFVSSNSSSSFIIGNGNTIGGGLIGDSIIGGSNNIIQGSANNVSLIGVNNYTALTSNVVVIPNLQFSTSAGTINGVSINTIISGSTIYTASTGSNTIIANNNTGNVALTSFGVISGGFNNFIN
ncbi:MAG TPA: hypothetical protein VNX68_12785 [Nitrosopumilaceae archaeon]|nr:hypothetical protein [Nitrosopumilaceae archaeon]